MPYSGQMCESSVIGEYNSMPSPKRIGSWIYLTILSSKEASETAQLNFVPILKKEALLQSKKRLSSFFMALVRAEAPCSLLFHFSKRT
jgi:hypothetical protein